MAEKIIKNDKLSKDLGVGAFSLGLSTIIVKILGLIYKIPLSSILGDEGMGYFNSAYAVYAFFYLLCTAGVPKAVMILVSEARARGREADEKQIIRTAMLLFVSLGVILTILLIVLSGWLSQIIGNSKSKATMIAIAPSIIFISISGVVRGFLNADMKLIDISVSQIVEGVGKLVVGILLASLGKRLALPLEIISSLTILGVSFGALFGLIYLLVCSKIQIFGKNIGQKECNLTRRATAKRIFSISVPITLSAAVMSLTNLIDLGLIMRSLERIGYSESQSSALYGNYTTLAVPMLNLAVAIITPISVSFLPLFTDCIVRIDNLRLKDTEKSALDISAFIAAPLTMGLMLFPREILDLLFKNSETGLGASLLCLLAPSVLLSSILININNYLESQGRLRAPLISMTVGSLVKIIASYFLITRSGVGIFGAPIGTVLSYATALFVSLIIYVCTNKQSPPILSTYFLPCILSMVAVGVARKVYDGSSKGVVNLIFSIMLAALLYLVLSCLLTLVRRDSFRKLAILPKTHAKNYQIRRNLKT